MKRLSCEDHDEESVLIIDIIDDILADDLIYQGGILIDGYASAARLSHEDEGQEEILMRCVRERKESAGTVVLFACDTFGVLPLVARLSREQALYYFLLGYTGVVESKEGVLAPQAVFHSYIGGYSSDERATLERARAFESLLAQSKPDCWLVNTGWAGGTCQSGKRIEKTTMSNLLHAVLGGVYTMGGFGFVEMPRFKLRVPSWCPGIENTRQFDPRWMWIDNNEDAEAAMVEYERTSVKLYAFFQQQFNRFGESAHGLALDGPGVRKLHQ